MKEIPTEARIVTDKDASSLEPLDTPPASEQDSHQPNIAASNGHQEAPAAGNGHQEASRIGHEQQEEPAASTKQNDHTSSTPPDLMPVAQNWHGSPASSKPAYPSPAQPSQGRAPLSLLIRGHRTGKRGSYTRSQKIIIWSALIVAFVAALPLGAYLAMKITSQQAQGSSTRLAPTATPVPIARTPDPRLERYIQQMVAHMTLDEELGQMIMVEWDEGGTFNADLQYMLVNQHAGGIILYTFNGNIQTRSQVSALTAAIQSHAKIPLLISIDQEGGEVNRLDPITGPRPSARQLGATNDPNRAYQQGVSDGQILKQLGINDNLAPDVDVQTLSDAAFNASSMAGFEYRMFGSTPEKVAAFAGAYLNGLQSQGIIGTLKHWPGLGADTVDPHDALPTIQSSRAELNSINFAPYRTLIAQGNVDMIMSTHELVPAYDKTLPATLSPILINQVLRGDLGYQGVIITDGLYMRAISEHWTLPQAAVLAVQAGNDILLGPYNIQTVQNVLDALQAAVTSGTISKARIDLSVERILALKIKYGLIQVPAAFM